MSTVSKSELQTDVVGDVLLLYFASVSGVDLRFEAAEAAGLQYTPDRKQ